MLAKGACKRGLGLYGRVMRRGEASIGPHVPHEYGDFGCEILRDPMEQFACR